MDEQVIQLTKKGEMKICLGSVGVVRLFGCFTGTTIPYAVHSSARKVMRLSV